MQREEEDPLKTPGSGYRSDGHEETHPAFGVAVVTRGSGTPRSLFQSDVLHQETITLSIETAERIRDLNHDWVHPKNTLVEVEMSLAQWGALVSSIGIGSGVPVTIRQTESQAHIPGLPYQPRIKENLDEVNKVVNKLLKQSEDSFAVLQDAIINKKGNTAVKEALRAHSATINNASANAEFAVKSLVAAGEKVTSQVRADIESQVLAAARLTEAAQGVAIIAPEIRLNEIED